MKNLFILWLLSFSLFSQARGIKELAGANPLLADPTIFYWDGVYYLYGTNDMRFVQEQSGSTTIKAGFFVYTSTDLVNWSNPAGATDGYALIEGDSYGTKGFWAPQVFHYEGMFYMAYTANEQIAIASSKSPLGPFKQKELRPISTVTRQIDPFVFFDEDGKVYLYHVRLMEANRLFVAEINNDFSQMDENTLVECIGAEPNTWEDTENAHWRVVEGPTVIKEDGTYYFFYSANDFRNKDYAVGYATSKSPIGPWIKNSNNPIISRHNVKHYGAGHGDLFTTGDKKLFYVLHTHLSESIASPRKTAIVEIDKKDGSFEAKPETFRFLNIGGAKRYINPVIGRSLPDPTVIKAEDGYFYLYATEDIRNLPIYKSKNLVDWTFVGTAFTDETRPDFEPNGGLWAPDINYINGKYILYYSMSVWGGEWTCGVGVATSDTPYGPFKDHGKVFRSNEIDVQNSIDPFYIEEEGRKYLFWGSFSGIYGIELSDNGLSIKKGAKKKCIAGTAFEGTYIHKKDGYFYLFASHGSCCEGVNSTYKLVVGRSKNLFGPYVDKSGKNLLNNYFEVVIDKNDRFVGNGHNSEIIQDSQGNDWMFYHGVDVSSPHGRVLLMDKINWGVDGWPFVGNEKSPSIEAEAPVF